VGFSPPAGVTAWRSRIVEHVPNYRRNQVEGGCFFFTVNLRDRRSKLFVAEIEALRTAVRAARARYPFHIDAWVVLPDHMHCLWTLPPDDLDFPVRWQMIKAMFSRSVPRPENRPASLISKRESGIWQRRYWEHTIRDEQDYAAHMDYIHFNPVKHGLAAHAADWPFSSFVTCVRLGMYPGDWAVKDVPLGDTGERQSIYAESGD
jgi:putative transposase